MAVSESSVTRVGEFSDQTRIQQVVEIFAIGFLTSKTSMFKTAYYDKLVMIFFDRLDNNN